MLIRITENVLASVRLLVAVGIVEATNTYKLIRPLLQFTCTSNESVTIPKGHNEELI